MTAKRGTSKGRKSSGRRQAERVPTADVLRLHTEVTRDVKYLIDRVCLERRQEGLLPNTQGELVEVALWNWLEAEGYAKR